jgi:hypothetical protein
MLPLISSDYQSFRQLSRAEIKSFGNISDYNQQLAQLKLNCPHYRHDVTVYLLNLTQILQSANSYSTALKERENNYSQLPTIKKIAHIIRKFIDSLYRIDSKIAILQQSLPTLINAAEQARKEANEALTPEELKAENEAVATKLELVGRVKQYLEQNPSAKGDRTASAVNAYVLNKFNRLNAGINVALPHFYHSTKDCFFDKIVKERQIKQSSNGAAGPGVYISTNIEVGYGPFAFAVDATAVDAPAKYFEGRKYHKGGMGKHNSLWISVGKDIKLAPSTIAHTTVEDLKNCKTISARLANHKFNVPVVTREVSYRITDVFEKVVPTRQISKLWKDATKYLTYQLPPNLTSTL